VPNMFLEKPFDKTALDTVLARYLDATMERSRSLSDW
jgi:hypothetical protein